MPVRAAAKRRDGRGKEEREHREIEVRCGGQSKRRGERRGEM
jgi:hypothetical protein